MPKPTSTTTPRKRGTAAAASPDGTPPVGEFVFRAMPMAEIEKLSIDDAAAAAATAANSQRAAYVTIGKIIVYMDREIAPPFTVQGELLKAGVKMSTINNARYLSRTYHALVVAELLSEEAFDLNMGYMECFNAIRLIDGKGKVTRSAKEVAEIIKTVPEFETELESLFIHGLTVTEKIAADLAAATPPTPPVAAPTNKIVPPVAGAAPPTPPPAVAAVAAVAAPKLPPITPLPGAAAAPVVQPVTAPVVATPAAKPPASAEDAIVLIDAMRDLMRELPADDCKEVVQMLQQLVSDATLLIGDPAEQVAA